MSRGVVWSARKLQMAARPGPQTSRSQDADSAAGLAPSRRVRTVAEASRRCTGQPHASAMRWILSTCAATRSRVLALMPSIAADDTEEVVRDAEAVGERHLVGGDVESWILSAFTTSLPSSRAASMDSFVLPVLVAPTITTIAGSAATRSALNEEDEDEDAAAEHESPDCWTAASVVAEEEEEHHQADASKVFDEMAPRRRRREEWRRRLCTPARRRRARRQGTRPAEARSRRAQQQGTPPVAPRCTAGGGAVGVARGEGVPRRRVKVGVVVALGLLDGDADVELALRAAGGALEPEGVGGAAAHACVVEDVAEKERRREKKKKKK
ncbi:hypothetical protein EJB05_04049, partial [Eragrostis curvula]